MIIRDFENVYTNISYSKIISFCSSLVFILFCVKRILTHHQIPTLSLIYSRSWTCVNLRPCHAKMYIIANARNLDPANLNDAIVYGTTNKVMYLKHMYIMFPFNQFVIYRTQTTDIYGNYVIHCAAIFITMMTLCTMNLYTLLLLAVQ